jgi:hypothetical protein
MPHSAVLGPETLAITDDCDVDKSTKLAYDGPIVCLEAYHSLYTYRTNQNDLADC